MAVVVAISILAAGGPVVGVAFAAPDAVSIDSATEYGEGTIEIVFNRSVATVDWVDVYVDGDDKGRISSPGDGTRIEVNSPIGDVTPNRNLTVVAQVNRGGNTDQVRRARDIAVATTTINASDAPHRSLANAAAAFQGEPVAFVSDGNTDVEVIVDERNGDTVLDQRTGANSEVLVFESDTLTPGTAYRAQFGTPDVDEWYNVSALGLTAQVADDELYLAQFAQVSVASADRGDVTVDLLDRFGTVVDTRVVTLGRDRRGFAVLRAQRAGRHSIDVTHNGTGTVVSTGTVTFETTPSALGSPSLSATLASDGVDPGSEVTLPITIVNNGSVQVGSLFNPALTRRVTAARGLTVRVKERGAVPVTVHDGTRGIGVLAEGRTAAIDVPVSIDAGATPGDYRVPINVTYRYTSRIGPDGVETTETVRRDLNVTLTVDRAPTLVVRNVTGAPRVGSTETLSVSVGNVGNAAANATRVSLLSPNPDLTFLGSSADTRFLGDLPSGENRSFAVEVAASTGAGVGGGEYPLEIDAVYEDAQGRDVTAPPRVVSIIPREELEFRLDDLSSTLTVGDDGELGGRITNAGDRRVTDAVAVLTDERRGMTVLERTSLLGTLAPNETAAFAFPVQLSERAEAGEKQFNVAVRYRSADDERHESDAMDGRAAVAPEPTDVRVEPLDAAVTRGGSGFLNLSVRNAGSGPYTDLTARLFAEGPISSAASDAHVERLASGEATAISLPVTATGSALEKPYPVQLLVRYDDPAGVTRTAGAFRLSVPVTAPSESTSGGLPVGPLVGAAVVLAVGILAYRRWRG